MECIYGFASSISRDLVYGAINQVRYPCCFNNFVKDLEKESNNLIATRDSVEDRVTQAKKQTRKTAKVVDKWLKDANANIDNVDELLKKTRTKRSCCFGHCRNWIWLYHMGKKLAKKKVVVEKCIGEGSKYIQLERVDTFPSILDFPSEKHMRFESRQYTYEQLMEALKDDEVSMIGLYGMGGCGKTTLAMEVGEKAKEGHLFDKVLFVPVSSTIEVRRIQDKIASALHFEFPKNENEEKEKAQRLHMRLAQENKILVILDDVWQMLDFDVIGIPSNANHKGCKVLITTRSNDVCKGMDCQSKIQLQVLTDDEAWVIFQKKAHILEATNSTLKHLARLVSNECKGLLIAIVAVASTLKGKAEVEWNVALDRLTSSKPVNIERGLQDPYKCLQLSYDNLDTAEAKSLFLICSIFPEDYEISVEGLTRCAIGLGIVGEICSYEGARNEVSAAKNKLISSCLLLGATKGNYVKMHDLVRNVAQWIAKMENKEYSSSRYLWCEKIPNEMDCSILEFLCMHIELEVPNELFRAMRQLKVLLLYNDGMQLLFSPAPFKSLTNLQCLLLENWKLGDISSLGVLKKLESLTLHKCSFLDLHVVLAQLKNLRLLDLLECDVEGNIFEVIGRLPQLEELYFCDSRSNWDAYNENIVEFFNRFSISQVLQRYRIKLGTLYEYYTELFFSYHRTLLLPCFHTSNVAIIDLAKRAEILSIANIQGGAKNVIPDIFQVEEGDMNCLIELVIIDSKELKCLVDTSNHFSEVSALFSNLLTLRIESMEHLGALCIGHLPPSSLFVKLEELCLRDCPRLTTLFTPEIAQSLVQLEKLEIVSCPKLKHILVDDDTNEINRYDFPMVFSKLKQLTVKWCYQLEYIFPATFAQGLLQLESLLIHGCSDLKYVFNQSTHGNQSANQSQHELKIELPVLEHLELAYMSNIISVFHENCCPIWPSLRQFYLVKCPKFSTISIHGSYVAETQLDHNSTKELSTLAMSSNQIINKIAVLQFISLQYLEKVEIYSCDSLKYIFSSSITYGLPQLKVLIVESCDKVKQIFEEHDTQSHDSMITGLRSITIINCKSLEYIFHVSFAQGLMELREIKVTKSPSLRYIFGQSIHNDVHSSRQDQKNIQIELPFLEKIILRKIPNLINISSKNYHVACSSLLQLFMDDVGMSTLPVDNLKFASRAEYSNDTFTTDISTTNMINIVQMLATVAIENNYKIEGIFNLEGLTTNEQQVTWWLEGLKLVNLEELSYIWRGAKNFVSLQYLHKVDICRCPKLKVIFTTSVVKVLPLLKILVVKQCENLQQIIEEDEENENVSNPQFQKICFSQLKLLLVTHCNNLKHLFYISTCYEFPELEYLIINQASHLVQVFESVPSAREGRVQVSLPKLKHVTLMQLPNLNNICQGIEFQNALVHNCPNLPITSTTTIDDMLKINIPDEEIDSLVRSELNYARDTIIEEATNKDPLPKTTSQFQIIHKDLAAGSKSELPTSQVKGNKNKGTQDLQLLRQKAQTISPVSLTRSIENTVLKEKNHEGSTSDEDMKAILLPNVDKVVSCSVIATHTESSGGDMLVQDSQVVELYGKPNIALPYKKIQNDDDEIIKSYKEGQIGVGFYDNIESPSEVCADTSRSHSLILAKLRALKHYVDLDDAQITLLMEAITVHPHLWNVCENFSPRFQAWMSKTLVDILSFLRNENAVSVTPDREKEFYAMCNEAIQLGFERSWVDKMRQRVMMRYHVVDTAQAQQLNGLLKRHDELTQELYRIKDEINSFNDFVDSPKKCFDFL